MKKMAILGVIAAMMSSCAWGSKATIENKADSLASVFYKIEWGGSTYMPHQPVYIKPGQVGTIDTTETSFPRETIKRNSVLIVGVHPLIEKVDPVTGAKKKGYAPAII